MMVASVGVGGAGEEGGELLMDGGGQLVALEGLDEPHADDALVFGGQNPQRIGIGAGANAYGVHVLCDGIAEIEMASVGDAVGVDG